MENLLVLLLVSSRSRHGRNSHPSEGRRQRKAAQKINEDRASTCTNAKSSKGGRPPADTERILQGILFRLREGCSWRALSLFAPSITIYTRWKSWCETGVWHRILDALAETASGKLRAIDSSCAKVHKHAFGGMQGPEFQCIGQSLRERGLSRSSGIARAEGLHPSESKRKESPEISQGALPEASSCGELFPAHQGIASHCHSV